MSILSTVGNSLYKTASSLVTSSPVKTVGITISYVVALNLIYPLGEWIGEKANSLSNGRIFQLHIPAPIKTVCTLYSELSVKKIVSVFAERESHVWNKLYMKYVLKYNQSPDGTNPIENILIKATANPPLSTIFIGPLMEEISFRLPLTFMSPGILKTISTIASSVIFATSHNDSPDQAQPGRITALITMGLFLAHVANNVDLTTAFLTHAGYNFLNWLI